jgi:predicted esterase
MDTAKAFKIPLSRINLSEYSQGGVMTLAEVTKHNLAGLLVFAVVLLTPHTLQNVHVNSPEIMFIHGENDKVVPLSTLEYTKQILLKKKIIS